MGSGLGKKRKGAIDMGEQDIIKKTGKLIDGVSIMA